MDLQVIDNFLPLYHFKEIRSIILGRESSFPWYWSDQICYDGDPFFQFYHSFYNQKTGESKSYSLLNIFNSELRIRKPWRVTASLTSRTVFNRKTGYHIDYPNIRTAIFYLDTNNGYTKFKKHGKVKSIENRIVIFNSNLEHQGVTCTDEKRRVVINFNYE